MFPAWSHVQTKINPGFYLHMMVVHLCDVTFSTFNIIHVNVIPDGVVSVVYTIELVCGHPATWWQYISVQSGKQLPPHFLPNLPGGQDSLQNRPKYPGEQSAIVNTYSQNK